MYSQLESPRHSHDLRLRERWGLFLSLQQPLPPARHLHPAIFQNNLAALLVAMPVLYVASFGAACWWGSGHTDEFGFHTVPAPKIFWPFGWAKMRSPTVVSRAICRLATLRDQPLALHVRADGETLTPCNRR